MNHFYNNFIRWNIRTLLILGLLCIKFCLHKFLFIINNVQSLLNSSPILLYWLSSIRTFWATFWDTLDHIPGHYRPSPNKIKICVSFFVLIMPLNIVTQCVLQQTRWQWYVQFFLNVTIIKPIFVWYPN